MSSSLIDVSRPLSSEGGQPLRIGEVAARTGLTQRTIRYYEELGLLPAPNRTGGDYRQYGEADVVRLQKIVRLRELFGFSLAEIRSTIDTEVALEQLKTEYRATEDVATRVAKLDEALNLTQAQMDLIDHKVAQMQELKSELTEREQRYTRKKEELLATLGNQDSDGRANTA